MDREDELGRLRRTYAQQIMREAGVSSISIENAFAEVRRERFLGPGPWDIVQMSGSYVRTPSADLAYLYTNDLVGIIPDRQINNGQPSFHAALMNQAAPRAGEHVVLLGDGATAPFREADVIYVNAGATRPADIWLDRLTEGGRLILPLTTDKSFSEAFDKITSGVVFRIEHRGEDYTAKWISTVAVFPCAGSRDEASEIALAEALHKGGEQKVTRLYRHDLPSPERLLAARQRMVPRVQLRATPHGGTS